MKRRSYIFILASLLAATMLVGCADKKKGNIENKTADDTGEVSEETEDSSAADNETADRDVEVSEDALEFDASEYVTLGDYKNLEVTYPSALAVTDEDVRQSIEAELEENTEYKEVKDRAAKEGDTVNIDYTGTIDGEEFEGGTDSGYDLELGSGDFLEDFENSLVGKNAGETAVFKLTFPEEYDESVAGKEAEFTVTINSISEAVVPEYNVDFVKSISDYETIKDYEASVKEQLEADAEDESKMEAEENALRLAVENAAVDGYPQKLYDFFYDDTVTGYKNYAEFMGMDYDEFLESFMSEEDIEEVVQEQVNEYLVVSAILQKEGQEISDSEYSKLAEEMAKENEYDSLEDYESDFGAMYIRTQVVREKALDLVYSSAKLKEVPYDEYYGDEEMEEESDADSE